MSSFFTTHLTILQLEGYSPSRFLSWWFAHPFTNTISTKKPLVTTPKIKVLKLLFLVSFLVIFLSSFYLKLYFLSLISLFILFFAPFIFLLMALILITPYEKINRQKVKNRTLSLIKSIPNLQVIGITGSYGKTSVKDFLYTILNQYQPTVKTPESFNTVFGITRVVDREIIPKTKYFICEMGAYVRGEIKEICGMVAPKYGLLTAIGSQHLERFKKLENTTLAKFELIDAVKPQNTLVNLDNPLIKKHLIGDKYRQVKTYSIINSKADYYVKNYTLSPTGTSFQLSYQNKTFDVSSHLFGTSNLYNLTAAIAMSLIIGVPEKTIKTAVDLIETSPHRLELKKINRAILIDNAYSSNVDGFSTILSDLKSLKGKKVLITPGIIELGKETAIAHQKLGQLASKVFDQIILVGHGERTQNLEKGIQNPKIISYIPNNTNLWPIIDDLSKNFDWILLENDLPDNY